MSNILLSSKILFLLMASALAIGDDGDSKPPDRVETTTASAQQVFASSTGGGRGSFGYERGNGENIADNLYFQPALIGFRCEGDHYITPSGVSVIEANRPTTLTLYGELFTTNTIIAFTTEFDPDSTDNVVEPNADEGSNTTNLVPLTSRPLFTNSNLSVNQDLVLSEQNQVENGVRKRRFSQRKRTTSKSYDCTDYNRVTSYRLTEANILTPNVAELTINLPELDLSAGNMNYYFCIKQPALFLPPALRDQQEHQQHNHHQQQVQPKQVVAQRSWSRQAPSTGDEGNLIWVHQGTEFWVTLKVEPPFMSVTNDCILMVVLLFLSAVTSGLNLGLMSLDMNELAVISSCGDQRERGYARTIAPLRKRGNYLLCSLLLGNVMVNSTLTVILEQLTSGVVAVIGSTLAIVVLGEIVPQAFCARQGLAIGARTIYLTYAFMILTFPLSWPISCLLDYFLGEEKGNVYDRERLMEFIRITGHHTQLEADEVAIISGALKLKKIKVDQIMTRIEDVFMLPLNCTLDRETIKRIIEKGYSRIPVYEFDDRKQIVALILAKDLALLDPDDQTPLANMLMYCKHPLIYIEENATLDVALNEFKTGKSHMAVVRQIFDDGETDKYYEACGVVTLEDVIEEVLQTEINDETDTLSDNRRKRRRTDAQVSNLMIEELISRTESSGGTPNTLDCELGLGGSGAQAGRNFYHQLPAPPLASAKMLPSALPSQPTGGSTGAQNDGPLTQSGNQQIVDHQTSGGDGVIKDQQKPFSPNQSQPK